MVLCHRRVSDEECMLALALFWSHLIFARNNFSFAHISRCSVESMLRNSICFCARCLREIALEPTSICSNHRPFPYREHLGNTNSVLQISDYTRAYPVKCNLQQMIPSTPLQFPDAGKTLYFAYHNYKQLAIANSVIQDTSCGGKFCDRQVYSDSQVQTHVPCGCSFRDKVSKHIVEHDIIIPCEESVDESGHTIVRKFRSFRFDQLVFRGGSQRMYNDKIKMENYNANVVLRSRFAKLVNLVNQGQGWTIVGWTRTGKIRDINEEGNKDAIDIAAEDLKPHVTFLQPSDMSDLDESKHAELKEILITESSFVKELSGVEKKDAEERSKKRRAPPE